MRKKRPDGLFRCVYESPLGLMEILGDRSGLALIEFARGNRGDSPSGGKSGSVPACLKKCLRQLEEYFSGRRRAFDLPLNPAGTPFQRKAWRALQKIPYGTTMSYKDIARAVGNERATRAVGGANHHNPLTIVIPCHRVVGSSGGLTGYGGGLWRKRWLLEHESRRRVEGRPRPA